MDSDGTPGASCEHIDMRIIGDNLYLSRVEVDKWAAHGTQVRFHLVLVFILTMDFRMMMLSTIHVLTGGKT